MKPQDLRIGNYVRIKETGEIVKVHSITPINIGYFSADGYKKALISCGIEPVLISEMDGFIPYIKYLEWYDREDVDIYHYKGTPLTDLPEWVKLANCIDRQLEVSLSDGKIKEVHRCVPAPMYKYDSEGKFLCTATMGLFKVAHWPSSPCSEYIESIKPIKS